MRHTRPLTDETRHALTPRIKQVAAEMDVSDKFLYGILAEANSDPFANFKPLFRAVCRTDVSAAAPFMHALQAIYHAEQQRQCGALVTQDAGSTLRVHRELTDVIDAALAAKPIPDQLREIEEAIDELKSRAYRLQERGMRAVS